MANKIITWQYSTLYVMMRNSIKHEKLVRKNDMKWHPWKQNVPHGHFFRLNLRLVWPAPATPLLLGLWPRGLLQRTTIGPVWKHVRGRCQPHLPMTEALVTIERKMPGSGVSLKHFGMKASQQKQYLISNQKMQLLRVFCGPRCMVPQNSGWLIQHLDAADHPYINVAEASHLVVSWGLWNQETCQRDCVFSPRIWALQKVSGFCWVDLASDSPVKLMPWHHVCLFLDQDVLHVEEPRWQSYFWPSSMMMWWSWESCIQAGWKSVALRTASVPETEGWRKWMSSTHEHEHYKMTTMILHSISCPRDWRIWAFLQNQIQPSAGIL